MQAFCILNVIYFLAKIKQEPIDSLLVKPKLEHPEMNLSEGMNVDIDDDELAQVKLELDMGVGVSKSADYDEWLEIQKELGVYASSDPTLNSINRKQPRLDHHMGTRQRANGEVTSELERDLLEDANNLEGLTLCAQNNEVVASAAQRFSSETLVSVHQDDITAQVQSAINSILSLKKNSGQTAQTDSTSDKLLDQAVRSILGSSS